MKKLCSCLVLAAAGLPALAGTGIGVSVAIGQPGFQGRIDIGRAGPPPVLIYPQPVRVLPSPIQLRVPPGHAKHWHRHCARYDACGRPVVFVREDRGRRHGRRG